MQLVEERKGVSTVLGSHHWLVARLAPVTHEHLPLMGGTLQMTLALIKPTVCSYQPDVSSVLRAIKSTPGLIVRALTCCPFPARR